MVVDVVINHISGRWGGGKVAGGLPSRTDLICILIVR